MDPDPSARPAQAPTVAVVGPCAVGKSALVEALRALGYNARHIAQEHSFVPDMWEHLTHPGALVYLDASFEILLRRRPVDWTQEEYAEQKHRLRHARQNASLYLCTDDLAEEEVIEIVLNFLAGKFSRTPG